MKGKLDTGALLSASFNQKLSEKVAMTVCAEVCFCYCRYHCGVKVPLFLILCNICVCSDIG